MRPENLDGLIAWLDGTPLPSARPIVTVSYAQSLDGSIAARGGARLRLSGPDSMRMTHRLRALHDAIMVGIGTVLTDDPQLTVREVQGDNPRPIIVDTHLRTPTNARVLRAGRPPLIAAGGGADPAAGAALVSVGAEIRHLPTTTDGLVDISQLVILLGALGVKRLMVEGGAKLITSFLNARLVDRVVITVCPRLVGGLHATGPIQPDRCGKLPRLMGSQSIVLGDDVVVWGELGAGSP